jgi:SAM-dependent methyltransferase
MSTPTQVTPDRILQAACGVWATGILAAAASHSLFTHLDAGADTTEQLARTAGTSPRGTQAVLDGLVGLGLVERCEGHYRNSAEASAFLVRGRPTYLGGFAEVLLADAGNWSALPAVVRTGTPVMAATYDVANNPFWEQLVPTIAPMAAPVARTAAEALGLVEAGPISILDVGGGSGIYSAIWLEINPAARATQLDWGPVNTIARTLLAEHGAADRLSCIDGDFHTADLGAGTYDVVVYSHIAHQESPQANEAMFARFRTALKDRGALVISDFIVDDDRDGPPFALVFGASMLLASKEGACWRRTDYATWLAHAGFHHVTFHPTPTPATLVIAR